MNSIVGKSTGIALLMAAALIAALFAMGVFSASGVNAGVVGTPTGADGGIESIVPEATRCHVDGDIPDGRHCKRFSGKWTMW